MALGETRALFYLVRRMQLTWRRTMRAITLALSAGMALAPLSALAAAPARPSGVTADARCLMTMAALTSAQDATRARTAQVGVIFFAGRIKAQDPSYDFGTRLKAVATGMTRETLTAEAQRCGPILVDTLRELDNAQKSFPPAKPAAPTGAAPAPAAKPPAKP
jgi:hypothetical protein